MLGIFLLDLFGNPGSKIAGVRTLDPQIPSLMHDHSAMATPYTFPFKKSFQATLQSHLSFPHLD